MRHPLLWLVLSATACASSQHAAAPGPVTTRTFEVSNMPGKLTITSSATAMNSTLSNSVDEVWKVLPGVLDSLGIKVTMLDPAARTIGIDGSKVRVQLGTTPLSRYLECGQTQVGQNADSYEVLLTVMSRVQAAAGGSTLSTLVDAVARPIAFRQDYAHCATKGLLEARIADAVKKKLQK